MKTQLTTVVLATLVCLLPEMANAQNRNTGSSLGSGGSSGFGSSGSSGFGNSGSSGFGGSGGFGSTGGNGFGGGTSGFGGQNGFGGNQNQSGFGNQNMLGNNANNGGILGRNTNQNQFLGRNIQNMGMGGNNQFGGGGGRNGGGNRGNNALNALNGGGNGNGASQPLLVRPRQKIAFEYRLPETDQIHSTLTTRLTKLSANSPGLKNVTIAMEEKGVAVLKGEVASESDAKLAENVLRLEPGIRTVRNELTFPVAKDPVE